MAIQRRITKIGGSLGLIIPRDLVESMGLEDGSSVRLSLVGEQLVIEPESSDIPQASFRRSFSAVLRRYGSSFKALADYDQGKALPKRKR